LLDGERAPWFALEPAAALESAISFLWPVGFMQKLMAAIAAMSIFNQHPAFSVQQKRFTAKDAKVAKGNSI
jgi:hypothetical protein